MLAIDDYWLPRVLVGCGLFGLEIDMSKETGGSAFPLPMGNETVAGTEGMAIHDYFAGKVLSLCYAQYTNYAQENGFQEDWRTGVAIDAYMMADAMIAARSK